MAKGPSNVLYAPPVVRDGQLVRGVLATDKPRALISRGEISREQWVLLYLSHDARVPAHYPEVDLYQTDPGFRDLSPGPQVYVTARDFTDPADFRPLGLAKQYDIIFNATWRDYKRPELMADALTYARDRGRPITCLWFGYHWDPVGFEVERRVVSEVRARRLPVVFEPTIFDTEVVNRRFNLARAAVICSTSEAGPRVMSEAMLAGLPYVATRDTYGGSPGFVDGRNGHVCEPTARSLAEGIWHVLDRLESFRPREWALENMCLPVALGRLKEALERLADQTGWWINLDNLSFRQIDWGGENRDVERAAAGRPPV